MTDRPGLIVALMIDRPLCVWCIADKSSVIAESVRDVLSGISSALVLNTRTDRCLGCGLKTTVYSIAAPQES